MKLADTHEAVRVFFSAYEQHGRPTCIVRISNSEAARSQVGGSVLWPKEKAWPVSRDGISLTPVLELFVDELPVVPKPLVGTAVLQVFLELVPKPDALAKGDVTRRSYCDGAYQVVLHPEAPLERRFQGVGAEESKRLVLKAGDSFPNGEDARLLISEALEDAFYAQPGASALFASRIEDGPFSRVGGWLGWLDDGGNVGEFVMQLDGDLISVDLGMDGQLYFGLDEGVWVMLWSVG